MTKAESRAISRIAKYMLQEFENSYQEVVLIPAPDPQFTGHMIRAVQYQNCDWYREFNQAFCSIRGCGRKSMKRARTYIKREHLLKALRHLIAGTEPKRPSIYRERLLDFIDRVRSNHRHKKQAARAVEDTGERMPF